MALNIKAGGSWVTPKGIHWKVGGVWQTAKSIHRKINGVWTQVWVSILAMVPESINGRATIITTGGSATANATATVTVTGGTGPFTYQWAKTGNAILINGTSATATFRYVSNTATTQTGTFTCTVTDATGAVVTSNTGSYALAITVGPR